MAEMTRREADKIWEKLTIADNFIFQKVMRKKRLCKRFIEKVLHIKIRKIMFPETEKDIRVRRDSKSVRLDVYVEDDKGVLYDIEMQTTNYADPAELPKRTRYYQAMMDMDVLNRGEFYTKLRKTYIIFICTFDPFDRNLSQYTFRETCTEDATLEMGDETTKIFLNSKGRREGIDRDLAALLDYIEGKAPKGKFTETFASAVETAKENKEMKVEYMTYYMELRRSEERGREEGREEGRLEALKSLVAANLLSLKDAAAAVGMSEHHLKERFQKLATN